jgi:hypothetical protein
MRHGRRLARLGLSRRRKRAPCRRASMNDIPGIGVMLLTHSLAATD